MLVFPKQFFLCSIHQKFLSISLWNFCSGLSALIVFRVIILNMYFKALIYIPDLISYFSSNSLRHISIKLRVAPNVSNASVVAFLGISLSHNLLSSSSQSGFLLSCATKELMRLYLFLSACVVKSSNRLPCNLEHVAVLYQGPLFNLSI